MSDTKASQRRSVYIHDEMWRKLRLAAIEHNTNVSELIREAIARMSGPMAPEGASEFVKKRSTGTHHHFETPNAVSVTVNNPTPTVSAEPEISAPPKTSETFSPELSDAFSRISRMLTEGRKAEILDLFAKAPEYQAWEASHDKD